MAIAVQSVTTSAFTASNTFTGTKPSGTVDGDLLLAFIANEGGQTVNSVPSGWTLLQEVAEAVGGDYVRVYWKEASSEPASWNWGFTASTEHFGGVLRIDGQIPTDPTDQDNTATINDDNTPSYANTITPTYPDSLIVMAIIANSQTSAGISSYAIATNNPTWTEQIDLYEGTVEMGLAVATAVRPEVTATGNSSATIAGTAGVDSACILFSITAITNTTVSPAVIQKTATVQDPTVTGTANVTANVVQKTAAVQDPTVTTEAAKWKNTDKSETSPTWTNKNKS